MAVDATKYAFRLLILPPILLDASLSATDLAKECHRERIGTEFLFCIVLARFRVKLPAAK
jgi:hypothetical protein